MYHRHLQAARQCQLLQPMCLGAASTMPRAQLIMLLTYR